MGRKRATDDGRDVRLSACGEEKITSGLFPKEWARIAGSASVTVVGKTLTSVAFFCTAYTASLAAAEHGMFAEHDLCALETARYFIALAGGVTWLGVLILGLAGGGPVAWAVFAALLVVDIARISVEKSKYGTDNFVRQVLRKIEESPLALEGHRQTFEVPNRLPGGGVYSDGSPWFRYPAYDLKLYYHLSFPRLFDHDIVMSSRWDELKKTSDLPFRALYPQKTVPLLSRRGWHVEDLVGLHYDAILPHRYDLPVRKSFSNRKEVREVEKIVETLYAQSKNETPEKEDITYYATMFQGEMG